MCKIEKGREARNMDNADGGDLHLQRDWQLG